MTKIRELVKFTNDKTGEVVEYVDDIYRNWVKYFNISKVYDRIFFDRIEVVKIPREKFDFFKEVVMKGLGKGEDYNGKKISSIR